MDSKIPLLVFVGGFLGAGKTTLILKAAEMLLGRGLRVAVIVNDQDDGLVDTRQARQQAIETSEVAGGCFCCRFSDLMDAAAEFAAYGPDVIFAEPVGSCVDLSATILQPLRAFHHSDYQLAPLTVLLDPAALSQMQRGEMNVDVAFLFRNQIAEADLLCLTKQDLDSHEFQPSDPVDFQMSARTGFGVDDWLREVMHTTRTVGARLLDIDYVRYAEAEAALGWLNLHCQLSLQQALSPALIVGPLLDQICRDLDAAGIQIAHLKIFDEAASGWVKAAVTSNEAEPQVEGDLMAEPALTHQLAINLRALGDPAELERIVRRGLGASGGAVKMGHLRAFRPAPPVPQHRFGAHQGN